MPHVRQHLLAFVITAAAISVVSFQSYSASVQQSVLEPIRAEIGVEHTLPLSLAIRASNIRGSGLIEIQSEGEEVISISVPSNWQRKEVRNAPLNEVTSQEASFGFTRYQLPAGAAVTFTLPQYPDTLILHNPSGITTKAALTLIDLATEHIETNVILVQDSPAQLW